MINIETSLMMSTKWRDCMEKTVTLVVTASTHKFLEHSMVNYEGMFTSSKCLFHKMTDDAS